MHHTNSYHATHATTHATRSHEIPTPPECFAVAQKSENTQKPGLH
ncbi:16618_t:CDS:1, partial [Racocetra fulgida]